MLCACQVIQAAAAAAHTEDKRRLCASGRCVAERALTMAIIDKDYLGVDMEGVRILRSGKMRGIT